jgi:NADH-quinone oxidoreductase subunit L
VDVFAIDGLLVNGVARVVGWTGGVFRLAQNGDVQRYAAVMAIAAAAILFSVLGVGGN